jgi:hypothetical protein
MKKLFIIRLPQDVTNRILSYLYFSSSVSKHIGNVNKSIKKYKLDCLHMLRIKYNIKSINYYILKFFLHDVVNSQRHSLNYDIMESSFREQILEVMRIFNVLTLIEVWRFYRFVCFNGGSSESFIHYLDCISS